MGKEIFNCRFCKFTTTKWKDAEDHFKAKHEKKVKKSKKEHVEPEIKKKIEKEHVKPEIKKKTKKSVPFVKRTENYYLMKSRENELKIRATPSECFLKDKFSLFFGKGSFIFQHGFFFREKNFFYIVDFFFPKKNLIIEIDGEYHEGEEQQIKDVKRESHLKRVFNIKILRYTNKQCFNDLFLILKSIQDIKSIETEKNFKIKEQNKYKCPFCSVICKRESKLKNHIKNSHK